MKEDAMSFTSSSSQRARKEHASGRKVGWYL